MRASIATPSEEPVETMETPQVIIEPTVIPIVQKVVYESKPKKDKHK